MYERDESIKNYFSSYFIRPTAAEWSLHSFLFSQPALNSPRSEAKRNIGDLYDLGRSPRCQKLPRKVAQLSGRRIVVDGSEGENTTLTAFRFLRSCS